MNLIPTGWKGSEFAALIGSVFAFWQTEEIAPEDLVWPTAAMVMVYTLSRALVKCSGTHESMIANTPEESVATAPAITADVPPPTPLGFITTRAIGTVVKSGMRPAGVFLAAFLFVSLATSCKSMDWLGEPVNPQPVTITGPDGSTVTGMPATQPAPPIVLDAPGGTGTVTIQPAQPTTSPTVGSSIGQAAGGIVGTVTGNPAIGAVVSLVLATLLGRRGKK